MKESVIIYEVKSSANKNADDLLSSNKKYFYWNDKFFKNMVIGDYVFVVNNHSKQVIFSKLDKKDISVNVKGNITSFNDLGVDYEVSGKYEKFIRLSIISLLSLPYNWKWKSLGSSETTYLNGKRINIEKAENRILNINQLKELSKEKTYNGILDECLKNFLFKNNLIENKMHEAKQESYSHLNVISDFEDHLKKRGLVYNSRLIKRFIGSLATKPFVILTGNSGSGKSKIALEFAKWMNLTQQKEKKKEYVKGQILSDNSGFIWRVEKSNIKWVKIDFYRELAKPFFNLYEFKGPDDCIIIADDKEYNARYTIYKDYPAIYAYRDFSKWLEHVGVGNFFKIEPILIEGTSNKLKFKVSKIAEDDKTEIIIKDEKRYSLIPVGADWTDNRSVLGYLNPLTTPESYVSTPILELIIEASKPENIDYPYFLILDEMNLSHVERYFSDFLSLIELPDQPINLHNSTETIYATGNDSLQILNQIDEFPKNLFVIGTVNVDETTYMFSPKVLDRANVIEIKTTVEDLNKYSGEKRDLATSFANKESIKLFLDSSFYSRNIIPAKWKKTLTVSEFNSCKKKVLEYFSVLDKYNLEFGFRTLDEALRYAQIVKEFIPETENSFIDNIIDEQVVQKFITKLNGSKMKMDKLLQELFELSYGNKWDKEMKFEDIIKSEKLAAIKLFQMIKRVNQDQFVSYI
ncbi:MAG TPA: hypothetical protein PLM70_08825 [Bacteroidales bacterium]|nr:hypothetical protein [Bacteroidales bacterium]